MGTCFSKHEQHLDRGTREGKPDRNNQAGLDLGNDSDYRVSYWVLQEDKVKATAIHERVLKTIEGSLNANLGGKDGVTAGAGVIARREAEVTRELSEVPYFLTRDHRIDPPLPEHLLSCQPSFGPTPSAHAVVSFPKVMTRTKVYFPKGCKHLRVYAFFQRKDDNKWVQYKDKVYSIDNGKKIYALDATNVGIAPYL